MKHWKKSKTLIVAGISSILVAAELNLHLVKSMLGEDSYNVILFGMQILIAIFGYLRTITTQPVARRKTVERQVQ